MIAAIIFIVIAYLCGSLSSAIIICKLLKLPDPRTQGSGNPGTTNVLRIGGKKAALFVLLGDVLKGFLPVLLAKIFGLEAFMLGIVGLAAVVGHVYPILFKFKGGKGVATALGALLALSVTAGFLSFITWLAIAAVFRYSSLASLVAAVLAPVYIAIFSSFIYFIPVTLIAILIIWRHKDNIERLRTKTEDKIQLKDLTQK
jgi:acyl phosphate:glycerol-3-phosphate acyltransferase